MKTDVGRLASWIFRLTCLIDLVTGFIGVVTVVAVGERDKLEDHEMVVAKLSRDCLREIPLETLLDGAECLGFVAISVKGQDLSISG